MFNIIKFLGICDFFAKFKPRDPLKVYPLSVGPIVGHVDINHARIWGRGKYIKDSNGKITRIHGIARFKEKHQPVYSPPLKVFKMSPNFDLTGLAILNALKENTQYEYQMGYVISPLDSSELNPEQDWNWQDASQGQFSTASHENTPLNFVFGSCRYLLKLFGGNWFDDRGDKTFKSILKQQSAGQKLDKLLMVGDQIYADDLNAINPDTRVDEFLKWYQTVFSQPHLRRLMSQVSTYMAMDDHEIEDNWPEKATKKDKLTLYPAAVHAYQVYQASHSSLLKIDEKGKLLANTEGFYYTFKDRCCDFFVLDIRTERNLRSKEMISDKQLNALLDWLIDGSNKVKMIVSAVPFFPDLRDSDSAADKWAGYLVQRDRIIEHIYANHLNNVVFLSGDVHCSMTSSLNIARKGSPAHNIYSIISSAFFWPYPHEKRRDFITEGHVPSATDSKAYAVSNVGEVYAGDNFSRVNVNPEGFSVDVYERKGAHKTSVSYAF